MLRLYNAMQIIRAHHRLPCNIMPNIIISTLNTNIITILFLIALNKYYHVRNTIYANCQQIYITGLNLVFPRRILRPSSVCCYANV